MIICEDFFNILRKNNINFYTGVPDSLLKDFCAYVTDNVSSKNNIIAANEGNAIALAVGYHLATKGIGLVYMQNSGLGNIVNPITSLVDPLVYSIPMLIVVGWRGEPGIKDEPQHLKQGQITLDILDTLGIKYKTLSEHKEEAETTIDEAVDYIKSNNCPYAIIISKGTFEKYTLKNKIETDYELSREEAIKIIVSNLGLSDIIVSTTGMASRELFEIREQLKDGHERDFLTVGSMGHASQIAMGIALSKPDRNIYCIDGDGALIMHMGALAIIGSSKINNFKHIVINNGAHDSVGGQPTVGFDIDICSIARACGYKKAYSVNSKYKLGKYMNEIKDCTGPALLEIKVRKGGRSNLGRPTISPLENKNNFMNFLSERDL